jgi:mRNA interferase HigB
MHIISKSKLKPFGIKYPNAETSLISWYKITEKAEWKTTADVRLTFRTLDFVVNFTVFDIGGNKYRLIAYIDYEYIAILNDFLYISRLMNFGKIKFMFLSKKLEQKFDNLKRPA